MRLVLVPVGFLMSNPVAFWVGLNLLYLLLLSTMQELLKMFNDSDSFFYSPTGDLTNTLQRQFSGKYDQNEPLWRRVRILKKVKNNIVLKL